MQKLFKWLQRGEASAGAREDASSRQLWLARGIALVLIAGTAVVTFYAGITLPVVPGFLAIYATAMIILSFLVAFLAMMKGLIEAQSASIRLGGGYLLASFLMAAQLLAYPGAIMPYPIIGGPATPFWLWVFWHAGFDIAIFQYAWAASRPVPPRASLFWTVTAWGTIAAGAIFAAVNMGQFTPPIFSDGRTFGQTPLWWAVPSGLLMGTLAALLSVLRLSVRSPEQLWLSVGILAAAIDIWLHWQGTNRFSLGFYAAKMVSILTALTVLLSKLHQITRLYTESATYNKHLLALVHKDGLTGLSNRRRFDEMLVQEFNRACRNSLPLGLILIDVDWFKCYNDTYGHLAGDECLRTIAGSVSGVLKRAGDEVARYGGEELVVLLPSTDLRGTLKIAQEMCDSVAALNINHAQSIYGKVTISSGVSVLDTFDTTGPAELVGAADKALYQAKSEGRNRVSSMTVSALAQKLCA